ncbi:hypothetical protein [Streptomyces yanii]|uniref:Uncharacterized protein n=1 Tax=Streptomyces yanii TaxID=78510 RepID=A0ABV5RQL6_9ACTN
MVASASRRWVWRIGDHLWRLRYSSCTAGGRRIRGRLPLGAPASDGTLDYDGLLGRGDAAAGRRS